MTTLQVLRKARALIAKGWCRYEFRKVIAGRRHYCSLGAIRDACGKNLQLRNDSVNAVLDVVNPELTMTEWNDSQHDKRPVLRAFDKAIRKLEEAA